MVLMRALSLASVAVISVSSQDLQGSCRGRCGLVGPEQDNFVGPNYNYGPAVPVPYMGPAPLIGGGAYAYPGYASIGAPMYGPTLYGRQYFGSIYGGGLYGGAYGGMYGGGYPGAYGGYPGAYGGYPGAYGGYSAPGYRPPPVQPCSCDQGCFSRSACCDDVSDVCGIYSRHPTASPTTPPPTNPPTTPPTTATPPPTIPPTTPPTTATPPPTTATPPPTDATTTPPTDATTTPPTDATTTPPTDATTTPPTDATTTPPTDATPTSAPPTAAPGTQKAIDFSLDFAGEDLVCPTPGSTEEADLITIIEGIVGAPVEMESCTPVAAAGRRLLAPVELKIVFRKALGEVSDALADSTLALVESQLAESANTDAAGTKCNQFDVFGSNSAVTSVTDNADAGVETYTGAPSTAPTPNPTSAPTTLKPTGSPTNSPTPSTGNPTRAPTEAGATFSPTGSPTVTPTTRPTDGPTASPTIPDRLATGSITFTDATSTCAAACGADQNAAGQDCALYDPIVSVTDSAVEATACSAANGKVTISYALNVGAVGIADAVRLADDLVVDLEADIAAVITEYDTVFGTTVTEARVNSGNIKTITPSPSTAPTAGPTDVTAAPTTRQSTVPLVIKAEIKPLTGLGADDDSEFWAILTWDSPLKVTGTPKVVLSANQAFDSTTEDIDMEYDATCAETDLANGVMCFKNANADSLCPGACDDTAATAAHVTEIFFKKDEDVDLNGGTIKEDIDGADGDNAELEWIATDVVTSNPNAQGVGMGASDDNPVIIIQPAKVEDDDDIKFLLDEASGTDTLSLELTFDQGVYVNTASNTPALYLKVQVSDATDATASNDRTEFLYDSCATSCTVLTFKAKARKSAANVQTYYANGNTAEVQAAVNAAAQAADLIEGAIITNSVQAGIAATGTDKTTDLQPLTYLQNSAARGVATANGLYVNYEIPTKAAAAIGGVEITEVAFTTNVPSESVIAGSGTTLPLGGWMGNTLTMTVTYDEAMTVTGTPTFKMNNDGKYTDTEITLSYDAAESSTKELVFSAVVPTLASGKACWVVSGLALDEPGTISGTVATTADGTSAVQFWEYVLTNGEPITSTNARATSLSFGPAITSAVFSGSATNPFVLTLEYSSGVRFGGDEAGGAAGGLSATKYDAQAKIATVGTTFAAEVLTCAQTTADSDTVECTGASTSASGDEIYLVEEGSSGYSAPQAGFNTLDGIECNGGTVKGTCDPVNAAYYATLNDGAFAQDIIPLSLLSDGGSEDDTYEAP